MADVMKTYNQADKGQLYSEKQYDHFEEKYVIFKDACHKLQLPDDQLVVAFFLMLTERARTFYFKKILHRNVLLKEIIRLLKAEFETKEIQQGYLQEWHAVSLADVIADNPSQTKRQCFDILIKKLEKIQPGLSSDYQTETIMASRIILAVQGISECTIALYNSATILEGLCSDLR